TLYLPSDRSVVRIYHAEGTELERNEGPAWHTSYSRDRPRHVEIDHEPFGETSLAGSSTSCGRRFIFRYQVHSSERSTYPAYLGATLTSYPDLQGQTAIVTGASRGIGLAIAKTLVANGMRVCITARNDENLQEAVRTMPEGSAIGIAGKADDPNH